MTRTRFHQGLEDLKEKLLVMAGMSELAVTRAIDGYRRRDRELCRLVFQGEKTINGLEREIDELAIDLLAMQQPMAVDLRFILSAIKINADLERVGDQAVNIAERAQHGLALPSPELPVDIPHMAASALDMLRNAITAFVQADAEMAHQVLANDDVVDRQNREIYDVTSRIMADTPAVAGQALDALLIARNLERIADHATNIAEDVIFWVRGADVRHSLRTIAPRKADAPGEEQA